MNNSISRLTLSDEVEQQKLEQKLAEAVRTTKLKNIQAFSQYAPYLLEFLPVTGGDALSIFCTKQGKANIVDYATGQCWYGENPELEIKEAFQKEVSQVAKISFSGKLEVEPPFIKCVEGTSFISPESFQSMQGERVNITQKNIPLLIQFGIGIGHVLREASSLANIENWLIYEPSIDVFKASVDVFDWASWLEERVEKGQQVYLQIGNNAATLVEDLQHIRADADITEAYVYRHCNHPEMDSLYQYLTSALFSWKDILEGNVSLVPFSEFCDEVPPISPVFRPLDSDASRIYWMEAQQRYLFNLQVLDHYYPEVSQAFRNFAPQKWHLFLSDNKTWNLIHIERNVALYKDDGQKESYEDLDEYRENPLKDDPLLDVDGGKLASYKHFEKTNSIKSIIQKASNESNAKLPDKINGIIFFGLGLGYQLEKIVKEHLVDSVYLYESNFDFFYASLFVLDWGLILKELDNSKGRLYLNLGDDGSHAREDLSRKIQTIGHYNIVSTYVYPVYFHSKIQQAIYELKQEFKSIVSLGEYFEHARYGVSHMNKVFASGSTYLVKRTDFDLYEDLTNYPVFIVGNGPSLDSSYEYILRNRHKAIVVSCGTALRALYRYGIKPDFHAEVEQNRATYDWVSNAADKAYLDDITLLSVNGVHPDTADLFGRTLLMFKSGEASTRAYTSTVCLSEGYPELDFAYPTVSNLVVSFMCSIGMKELYLFGVDLGFKELDHHHSKQSDYYTREEKKTPKTEQAEKEIDYSYIHANGLMVVPGNFEEKVFTKREFSISGHNIERVLSLAEGSQCFNCSDGARILGAIPLRVEDICLSEQIEGPRAVVNNLLSIICTPPEDVKKLAQDFESFFNLESLKRDVDSHVEWLREQCPHSEVELEELLSQQRERFYSTLSDRSSLFFYMFWGSMNYISSLMIKFSYTKKDEQYEDRLKELWDIWSEYMQEVFYEFYSNPTEVDKTQTVNGNFVSNDETKK